jgi:hypothetical protein
MTSKAFPKPLLLQDIPINDQPAIASSLRGHFEGLVDTALAMPKNLVPA